MKKLKIMKNSLMKSLAICAAVLMLGLGGGCVAALAATLGAGLGAAGTAYYEGRLTSTFNAGPEEIKSATVKAFKDLNINLVSATADSLNSEIIGNSAENSTVAVSSSLQKDGRSNLGIRVGTFGDQAFSLQIYAAIDKHLPKKKK